VKADDPRGKIRHEKKDSEDSLDITRSAAKGLRVRNRAKIT
jgi:hypothetical protein